MKWVREITIQFLMIDSSTWIAYIDNLPEVNYQASSLKAALKGVLAELVRFDASHFPLEQRPINHYTVQIKSARLSF